jgi:hypothetical protein
MHDEIVELLRRIATSVGNAVSNDLNSARCTVAG